MVRAHRFVVAKKFVGEIKVTDFTLVSEELRPIADGEVLARAEFISVDPYMRIVPLEIGTTMIGGQVAEVLESRNAKFPVGAHIFGDFGWRSLTIFHPDDNANKPIRPYVLPDFGELPRSLGLGVLGMTGNTAWFGFHTICKPQPGETVLVTGAAGAVGSLVGQLAKVAGCTVIGVAGDDAKCAWLRSIGFDHAINYKTADVAAALKVAAPSGVDVFFDNVGGQLAATLVPQMRLGGRICVCGSVSSYNRTGWLDLVSDHPLPEFEAKQLIMSDYNVWNWADEWLDGIRGVLALVADGRVQYRETVTDGFERLPVALIDCLRGGNTGKAIVRVRE